MVPAPPYVVSTSTQAWKLIEKDYTLRRNLVANRWDEEYPKAKNMLFAETRSRGNAAHLGPAWVKMEIAHTNQQAQLAYKTCCEIWEIQGRPKCRAFFRAVFDRCLQPLFSTRACRFKHEIELHQMRSGRMIPQGTAIFLLMNQALGRLRSEWRTRLEIATRDNEYQQLARQREARASRAIAAKTELSGAKTNSRSKGLLLNYRSEIKRAILTALTKNPKANDLAICRALDNDGAADLPTNWQPKPGERQFEKAYKENRTRPRIEQAISKVRADLRKEGLLPDR